MKKFSKITASVLAFFLAFAVIFSAGADIRAAGKKNIKTVTVKMDSRKVNGKTVSMQRGKSSSLKVSASPKIRKTSVSYKSSRPSCVSVNSKGRLTAKKAGTAKISITVRASGYKAKTVRVNIRVVDNAGTGPSQEPGTDDETDPSQKPDADNETDPSQEPGIGNETDPSQEPSNNTGKALVVYFSCTGTTAGVARTVADAAGADIYEIQAQEPYTSADLNYGDSSTRATREQNDPSARPAIAGSTDISSYDVIYIGYPIWWGVEPRIIDTFLESYDFSGKKIAPFCTSGSSGISGSVSRIRELAAGAEVLQGMRFPSGASRDEAQNWLGSLGI